MMQNSHKIKLKSHKKTSIIGKFNSVSIVVTSRAQIMPK